MGGRSLRRSQNKKDDQHVVDEECASAFTLSHKQWCLQAVLMVFARVLKSSMIPRIPMDR